MGTLIKFDDIWQIDYLSLIPTQYKLAEFMGEGSYDFYVTKEIKVDFGARGGGSEEILYFSDAYSHNMIMEELRQMHYQFNDGPYEGYSCSYKFLRNVSVLSISDEDKWAKVLNTNDISKLIDTFTLYIK